MDDFCKWLLLFAYSKITTLSDYHHQILEFFYDEDQHLLKSDKINVTLEQNNVFWFRIHMESTDTNDVSGWRDETASLMELVNFLYRLCEIIWKDYELVWHDLCELLNLRLAVDEIDGEDLRSIMSEYEGELYLRCLYLSLENQRMVDRSEEQGIIFSNYIRSRQQCLYGCFCFMVLFISMCYSDDLMNVKNVD